MTKLQVEKDIVVKRMEGIEAELVELRGLGEQSVEEFATGEGWKLAQFHLHRALEGVFNIGAHILSRIPGAQATQYREVALKLGEAGIVSKELAARKLVEMAKYRNRLVHFYAQIEPGELYRIIKDNLGDIETFLAAVRDFLADPGKFGLEVV